MVRCVYVAPIQWRPGDLLKSFDPGRTIRLTSKTAQLGRLALKLVKPHVQHVANADHAYQATTVVHGMAILHDCIVDATLVPSSRRVPARSARTTLPVLPVWLI